MFIKIETTLAPECSLDKHGQLSARAAQLTFTADTAVTDYVEKLLQLRQEMIRAHF